MSQNPGTDLDNTLLLETSKGPVEIRMRPDLDLDVTMDAGPLVVAQVVGAIRGRLSAGKATIPYWESTSRYLTAWLCASWSTGGSVMEWELVSTAFRARAGSEA